MAVSFVNCFEIPAAHEEEFLAFFREVNAYMQQKPGYVGHRMHRSLAADAKFRFVNYAVWESPQHWRDAHDSGFRALAARATWPGFTTTHALYEIFHEGGARI